MIKRIIKYNNNKLIIKKSIKNTYIKFFFFTKLGKLNYIINKNIINNISIKKKSIFIIYNKKNNFIFNVFNNILFSMQGGYFIKFNIIGRGYNINLNKINKNILELKLGYSHKIKYYLPKTILIKKLNKSNFIIFSLYYNDLKYYAKLIQKYKTPDKYKGKGILFEKEVVLLKEGKKKF